MFNSARLRRRHFYDELMNTLLRQPMQQVDSAITYGVSCLFMPILFSRLLRNVVSFAILFNFVNITLLKGIIRVEMLIT